MSIERRLAAKERSRKARKRAAVKKWTAILFLPVIALCILIGVLIHKAVKNVNYSKYITDEGTISGVVAKECFSKFPDLNAMDIDFEPTEEEIAKKLESTMKSLESAAEAKEKENEGDGESSGTSDSGEITTTGAEDTKTERDYEADLTQEWVDKYAIDALGESYAHTPDGFREYVKHLAHEDVEADAASMIETYLLKNCEIKSYPFWFTRNQRKIVDKENEGYFELLKAIGYTSYATYDEYKEGMFESRSAYRKELKAQAKEVTKEYLIWLAVFDELQLTASVEDAKALRIEKGGKSDATEEEKNTYWNNQVEAYGQPYLMLQYRISAAKEKLTEKVLADHHATAHAGE